MDSARSWVLAAACCWINTFSFALFRASPVIYVGIMGTFRVTRQEAAWPLFLSGVFYCAMALGAGLLARRVAIWKLTLSGCLLSSLSVSVCFFANGIPYLTFFLGATHGCGIACLTLCNTVISQHFCRYRTVASGISNAGFTLGSFLYPPLLQFFLDEYGTKASLLLCGSVMLNATAGALLHRLPRSAPRKPVASFNIAETRLNCPRNDNTRGMTWQDISGKSTNLFEDEVGFASEMDDRFKEEALTVCTRLADADATGHLLEKNEAEALRQAGEPDEKCAVKESLLRKQPDRVFKTTLVTTSTGLLSFLWLRKFYLITAAQAQVVINMSTYLTVIVDLAMDRGISKWDSVFLLFFYAMADLLARLGSGWITDKGLLKRSIMMALSFLLWSTSLFLMPLCYSFYLQAVLSLVAGWCNGATFIITPVLFMELVGVGKFSVCFGTACLLVGVPLMTLPALIGYFRDTLGNYQGLFFLIGGLTGLTASLWLWAFLREKEAPFSEGDSKSSSIARSPRCTRNSEG
ncbi:uncharacterized protein LOC8037402 [Ixodes scapularis]|uniref:uncharacterized protein LOC8037402 n=1 Tax=Ixodes scapularis TaxID=6945 RepID=UPI001A9FD202|nr:uncharacterized protein LOC8037402 [Ixodes scapularis]